MSENTDLLDALARLSSRLRQIEEQEEFVGYDIVAPAYAAPIGTQHWDSALRQLWMNYDGTAIGWQLVGGGGIANHTILNGGVHTDSALQVVSRGSLIYGDATPLWNELVHPAAANRLLTTDANDVLWSTWALVGTAGQTYTLPATSSTLQGGTGVSPQVAYWSATANVLAGDAGFTYDAANDVVTITPAVLGGLTFAGATTANRIRVPDNLANALYLDDAGGLSYLLINSTNANPYIELFPAGGGSVKSEWHSITNTIFGVGAGDSIGAGTNNTTFGYNAGTAITNGTQSVAVGSNALLGNANFSYCVAIGYDALTAANPGNGTIAIGRDALRLYNAGGTLSALAIGVETLENCQGLYNTCVGHEAFTLLTTGVQNTAFGQDIARGATTSASYNTASGYLSLRSLGAANYNTAYGWESGYAATAGFFGITTATHCTMIGHSTGFSTITQRNYAVCLGAYATANQANSCIIGTVSTGTAPLDMGLGTDAPGAHFHQIKQSALTSTQQAMHILSHNTSGAPAALFGAYSLYRLESSTTTDQDAAKIEVLWCDPTHATRNPLIRFRPYPKGTAQGGGTPCWTWDAVDGTARTVIPNGAGDVTRAITFLYVVYAITGTDTATGLASLEPGDSWQLYNDGTDVLTAACAADGSVTVQRTAGADTFDVAIMGVWF